MKDKKSNQKFPQNDAKSNTYYALFGLLQRRRNPNGTWSLKVMYGRLFILLAIFLLVLWLMKSAFVLGFFKYNRDFTEITFGDAFVFPINDAKIRNKQGEKDIDDAKKLIKLHKWMEAYVSLDKGVKRSPKNVEGRQMLAELEVALFKRPDLAIATLERGLLFGINDFRYIRLYLRLLIDQNEDKKLIKVAGNLLEREDLKEEEVVAYLSMAAATVYSMHGNYAQSNEMLVKYGIDRSVPGLIRISKNEWEQGNTQEAIRLVLDNINYSPKKAPLYALLSNYYSALGDYDSALKYSAMRAVEDPFSVEQRVERLELLHKAGRFDLLKYEKESFFEQHEKSEKAMLLLANFSAESKDIEMMRKIYDTALQRNYRLAPFCLLLMETMLSNNMFKEASDFAENLIKDKPSWMKRYEDVFSCLRAVSYFAIGNSNMADILLNDVLSRSTATPKVLIATARKLDQLNGTVMAHKLLESATDRFPRHQLALTRLVQMEIKIGNSTNIDKHILKLLQMRRPPRLLIESARDNLSSDRFIFAVGRDKIMEEIDILIMNKDARKAFSDTPDMDKGRIMDEASEESVF